MLRVFLNFTLHKRHERFVNMTFQFTQHGHDHASELKEKAITVDVFLLLIHYLRYELTLPSIANNI